MSASITKTLKEFCQENKLAHIEPQLTDANVTLSGLLSKNEESLKYVYSMFSCVVGGLLMFWLNICEP